MKTGMNVEIRDQDLTHQFIWRGKIVPIGRFDPSAYPEMSKKRIKDLGQEIFDQLEDSHELSNNEMEDIVGLTEKEFNACIKKRK